jgi:hypothetical protein
MEIFLSYSFDDKDRDVVNAVERLCKNQDVQVRTGEVIGGNQIPQEVYNRIDKSDAVVSLWTRDQAIAGGGYTTHWWVVEELNYARRPPAANEEFRVVKPKHTIALLEDGVPNAGPYAHYEHIPFDRTNPDRAYLRLVNTIGLWKKVIGRAIRVQLTPDHVARAAGRYGSPYKCYYRFSTLDNDNTTEWFPAKAKAEAIGTFLLLRGVRDEHMIEIMVENGAKTWSSRATPLWMPIELEEQV